MDAELKRKWVEALRSGEYTQTHNVLRARGGDGGYCCLGVLCIVAEKPFDYEFEPLGLSERVANKCAELNDGLGLTTRQHTFPEIADYIEKNL